jgi:hypothetical protein
VKVHVFGNEPNFAIGQAGTTIFNETIPFSGIRGYLVGGFIEAVATISASQVTCTLSWTYVDQSDLGIGGSTTLSTPSGYAQTNSTGRVSIPLTGVIDLGAPPAGAANVRVLVTCLAVEAAVEASERRLTITEVGSIAP